MNQKAAYELTGKPKLLIVDGAGTLFDPRSMVPAYAFQAAFAEKGIDLDLKMLMKYMGKAKREHIQLLLKENEILNQFQKKYDKFSNEEHIEQIYASFKENLYPSAAKTKEIKGVKEATFKLKKAGIPLVMTTGYDRKMVEETIKKLPWLSKVLADSITSSDVEKGRPNPAMIRESMKRLKIKDNKSVINVGDTKVDIEAADNAHVPGIIVLSGTVTNNKKAEEINKELGRKHLVLPSLAEVIKYILDNTLANKIKELNH